jgi:hypothetical protein
MLDHLDQDEAHARALREADYAPLTRRAVTANSRALIDDIYQQIVDHEVQQGTRKRKRVGKAPAFVRALEGFVGDLLDAFKCERAAGWVRRSVTPRSFTNTAVSFRDFDALREALVALGLVEEKRGVQHWAEGFTGPFPLKRFDTRFRATAQLQELATAHGIALRDVGKHFIASLPAHPLVLKGGSCRAPEGYKIPGHAMKFARTGGLQAMEQTVIDLNSFLDQFTIRDGTHRGYIRVFNCGDHDKFNWDLGGRLYSQGDDSYQQMSSAERLRMTIDGKPVCELDIKASYLTIFHARQRQPLDFDSKPDPYQVRVLSGTPRSVVKAFITATFGIGQFPAKWSRKAASDYKAETGKSLSKLHPISQVRDAVTRAYPLLAELRQSDAEPPLWARVMYLESQALFRTMLALMDDGIPSLAVHDSLIVQCDREEEARDTLSKLYEAATGAKPRITTKSFKDLSEC